MKKHIYKASAALFLFLIMVLSTQAAVGVINGLTHERVAKIGEAYGGVILLKNTGLTAEDVKLYQRDFRFTFEGKKFYDKPGQLQRSNASWITFSPQRVTVAPGGSTEIRFNVHVPDDTVLKGTYWSLIMVEGSHAPSSAEGAPKGGKITFHINQVMRYAVQIVTHIENSGERNVKFLKTGLLTKNGKKILTVDVENTGERWLRPTLYLDLFDSEGKHQGKYKGERWRIYPGTSVRYQVDLSGIPKGKYTALLLLDNNDDYVFGAQYTLDFNASFEERPF